jgi:hypothetical protein
MVGAVLRDDVVDPASGEVLASTGTTIDETLAARVRAAGSRSSESARSPRRSSTTCRPIAKRR